MISPILPSQKSSMAFGLTCLLLPHLQADDWKAKLFTGGPGSFPAFGECEMTFDAGWKDIAKAGQLKMNVIPKGDFITVSATGASVGAANQLLPVKGEYLVKISTASMEPVGMEQTRVEGGKTQLATVQLSPGKVISKKIMNPGGQGGEEVVQTKEFEVPRAFDLVSSALFLRSLPLKEVGERYTLAVVVQSTPRLMTVEVTGKEQRRYQGEMIDAVKVTVTGESIKWETAKTEADAGDKIKAVFKGSLGDLTAWISDDDRRLPLAVAVGVKPIGTVEVTLVDFK